MKRLLLPMLLATQLPAAPAARLHAAAVEVWAGKAETHLSAFFTRLAGEVRALGSADISSGSAAAFTEFAPAEAPAAAKTPKRGRETFNEREARKVLAAMGVGVRPARFAAQKPLLPVTSLPGIGAGSFSAFRSLREN